MSVIIKHERQRVREDGVIVTESVFRTLEGKEEVRSHEPHEFKGRLYFSELGPLENEYERQQRKFKNFIKD